jgi:hypothetical protein
MAATRTQGITIDTDGNFTINKEYRGIRLFFRLGKLSQDQAEQRLHTEIDRVDCELERKAYARPRFAHCAARYLDESRDKRSFDVIALHVRLLISHLGGLEVKQIHDATLKPFVADRLAAGVSPTTIIGRSVLVRQVVPDRCHDISLRARPRADERSPGPWRSERARWTRAALHAAQDRYPEAPGSPESHCFRKDP